MSAGSIVIDLLMRTGSFETDTKRATKALDQMKREAIEAGKRIGTEVAAGVVVVGAALVAMVEHALNAADSLSKLAQKTGITTSPSAWYARAASRTVPISAPGSGTRCTRGDSGASRVGTGPSH